MEIVAFFFIAYAYGSLAEHLIHRFAMHKQTCLSEWIYKDHALHHGVYRRGTFNNPLKTDKRFANLFLCLEHVSLFSLPALIVSWFINPLLTLVIFLFSSLHFWVYNKIHSGVHLSHELKYLPRWYYKWMAWNHFMHHQHPEKFFSVALPGADYIMGTTCQMNELDEACWRSVKRQWYRDKDEDRSLMFKFNECTIPELIKKLKFNTTDGNIPYQPTPLDYEKGQKFCKWLLNIELGKINVIGKIPDEVCILAPNHSSWIDVFLFQALLDRPIRLMAAESVLRFTPILGWFLPKYLGAYPASTAKAVDSSIKLINWGQTIVVYPEGWAFFNAELHKFKTGTVRIAEATNASIVPIYIKYYKLPPKWLLKLPFYMQCILSGVFLMFKGETDVIIGEPFKVQDDIRNATDRLKMEIELLRNKHDN